MQYASRLRHARYILSSIGRGSKRSFTCASNSRHVFGARILAAACTCKMDRIAQNVPRRKGIQKPSGTRRETRMRAVFFSNQLTLVGILPRPTTNYLQHAESQTSYAGGLAVRSDTTIDSHCQRPFRVSSHSKGHVGANRDSWPSLPCPSHNNASISAS